MGPSCCLAPGAIFSIQSFERTAQFVGGTVMRHDRCTCAEPEYEWCSLTNRVDLSESCKSKVAFLFCGDEANYVREILVAECGRGLPFCDKWDSDSLDRLRFAVLKLSEGSLDKFDSAIDLAKTDWRDLLVAAGFAEDVEAHQFWDPRDHAA